MHSGGEGGGFSFADRQVRQHCGQPGPRRALGLVRPGRRGAAVVGFRSAHRVQRVPGEGRRPGRRAADAGAAGSEPANVRCPPGSGSSSAARATRAFVGMADESRSASAAPTAPAGGCDGHRTGEVQFDNNFGQPNGPSTLSLFGSRIGDTGGGVLFIRSGGGVVSFDGADSVGINTRRRSVRWMWRAPAPPSRAGRGGAVGTIGVHGIGYIGLQGEGQQYGVFAAGCVQAGSFNGRVQVTSDLTVGGTIRKGGGGFRIDHPADPAGKYLSHSFVESPGHAERLRRYRHHRRRRHGHRSPPGLLRGPQPRSPLPAHAGGRAGAGHRGRPGPRELRSRSAPTGQGSRCAGR